LGGNLTKREKEEFNTLTEQNHRVEPEPGRKKAERPERRDHTRDAGQCERP